MSSFSGISKNGFPPLSRQLLARALGRSELDARGAELEEANAGSETGRSRVFSGRRPGFRWNAISAPEGMLIWAGGLEEGVRFNLGF